MFPLKDNIPNERFPYVTVALIALNVIAYLHTDMLYSKDKEEHPRALHGITTAFRQLKQDARADEFAQRLKQEYPRSVWTRTPTSGAQ